MEQRTFKNVKNYFDSNIYTFSETSGGQSSNLYLNVVHFIIPDILDPVLQPDPTFSILYTLLILLINNV